MGDAVRCVLPRAAHPPQLPFGQGIKEAEAEIAQIKEQQTPHRESVRDASSTSTLQFSCTASRHSSRSQRFSPQIKEASQFESCAGWIVCAQAPPGLEIPAHRLESGFIETEDFRSKGDERCGCRLGSGKGQPRIDSLPHFLEGDQASLEEPFDQAIAREPERSKWAD